MNLESTVQESAQEKNNIANFQLEVWILEAFLVVFSCNFSHSSFFLLRTGGKCYLNHLLERDVLEFSRTTVLIMWNRQQRAVLVCSPGSSAGEQNALQRISWLQELQHWLTHLGSGVTAKLHVTALKAFSEGASQGKRHFLSLLQPSLVENAGFMTKHRIQP